MLMEIDRKVRLGYGLPVQGVDDDPASRKAKETEVESPKDKKK